MDRADELQKIIGHRAQLIEQIKNGGHPAVLNLRLDCVEQEFRRQKAKQNSLFEKMRHAFELLLERP